MHQFTTSETSHSRASGNQLPPASPTIAVVIVAHNREDLVVRAIRSIYRQIDPEWDQHLDRSKHPSPSDAIATPLLDLILVDSASNDQTLCVMHKLAEIAPAGIAVKILQEPGGCASRARNLGWQATGAEFVGFLDDDAEAETGWMLAALEHFQRRPHCAVIAGKTSIAWLGTPPSAEISKAASGFTSLDFGENERQLHYPQAPIGPNMFFRRTVLQESSGFSETLGPAPGRWWVCEEGDLSLRIERAGWEVWYSPEVRVLHMTPAARVTHDYLMARAHVHGYSRAQVDWRHFRFGRVLHQIARVIRALLRAGWKRDWSVQTDLDLLYSKAYFLGIFDAVRKK